MSRQIKTIGIVGGLGPESTIEYYRQIIARYREQISDGITRRSLFKAWTCQNCFASVERMNFATVALSDRARESWVEPDLKHFLKDVF
jgi:aspartate/glutamate racemase